MTPVPGQEQGGFVAALAAPGRSREIPESMDVYGWLVGSWDLDVVRYRGIDVFGRQPHGRGALRLGAGGLGHPGRLDHAAPRGPHRPRGEDAEHVRHHVPHVGSGDPGLAHHLEEPGLAGHYEEQIGRRIGPDIVQLGARSNGTPTRWTFTEITPDSFRWLGEALEPDGTTWRPEGEFRARRRH